MVATETAKTVVLILFGLCVLWLIIVIVKNDMQTFVRALFVTALMGLSLYYLNQTKLEKLSFAAVKEDLFPPKMRNYAFEKREGFQAGRRVTTYVFQDPGPPLSLSLEEGGKYMAIKDIRTVNRALAFLSLPPVEEGVPELSSITGMGLDADKFVWEDYERGELIVERGICHDMNSAQSYTCIARITIISR